MKVLILREHHGNRYFDVSTPEKFEKVALSIVKGRFSGKNDYYCINYCPPPPPPDITEEQYEKIGDLPECLKKAARNAIEGYRIRKECYDKAMRIIDEIHQCINNNDGKLALRILKARREYEDEGYEIVDVDEEYKNEIGK